MANQSEEAEMQLVLKAQVAAINWLIGRCEDQMVRGWLVQQKQILKGAGSTPEYFSLTPGRE